MSTYYRLKIMKTAKPQGGHDREYDTYDVVDSEHATIAEAIAHLKTQLWSENCKRVKLYRDGKNGEAVHAGYIYCFNSPAYSYDDCKHHEQWWVSICKMTSSEVSPKEWGAK